VSVVASLILVLLAAATAAPAPLPDVRMSSPLSPPPARRIAPPGARTPTIMLPPSGLPVTPNCEVARAWEGWSGLPCGATSRSTWSRAGRLG
jgi:hypothetical protein